MAIVTTDFLAGVFTNFRALWQDAFIAAQQQLIYPRLALEVPSTTLTESYNWLGTVPIMKKWVDERQHQGMYPYNYSLTNDHFEVTIDVDRDTFEDDRIGQVAPRISQLGMEAPRFIENTAITAIDQGATTGNNSYDGVTFYNSTHITGVNAAGQTNLLATAISDSNVTLANAQIDFTGAKAQMRLVKDDQGRQMNLLPDLALVPPNYEQVFAQLLNASFIPSGSVGSMQNTFIGQSDLAVSAYLTDNGSNKKAPWHLLATKSAAWRPLIFQNRKAPEFVSINQPDAQQVFDRRMFSYGVDTRFKVGYGMWETAIKIS